MSNILNGITEAKRSPEPDYDDPSWDEKVSNVGQKAKQAEVLKSKGKEPKTRWNPETKKYYVDFSDDDVKKESVGIPYPGTYEQTNDMFKSSGQKRIGTLTTDQGVAEGVVDTIKKVGKALVKPVGDPILSQMKDISDAANARATAAQNKKDAEKGVAEGSVDHRELGKHHEEMTDQELRKVGSKLPDSWDAAVFRRKLASHPKYAQALKHYDKSEYHFGKAARQGVAEGLEIKIPTEDGITMQDIRLMAGEGPLTKKTVLQAIAVIRKQRRPQGVAEVFADQGSGSTAKDNAEYMKRRKAAKFNQSAKPSKPKNQQEYDAIEKYRKDLAQTYNKPKKEQGVAEGTEQQWTVTVGTKTGGTSHTMTFSGTKEQAIKKAVARFGTSKNPVVNAVPAKQGVAEGLNEFAPDGFTGGGDGDAFSPAIAKMAQEDGFTKGAGLADGATLERAITINHWHSQHGGMYKQYFAKGFKSGRMNKINHDNKQYNLNLKLMKDGSIRHGEQGVAEAKQRLDPKCWTGKHKEGTKMKGGVRVNNCVPNESAIMKGIKV